jgi:hypothetical protein
MLDFVRRPLFQRKKRLQEAIRKSVRQCAVCVYSLDNHYYWDIGSAVVGSQEENELTREVEGHNWMDASSYQNANAVRDVRVWRATRCPVRRIAIFPVLLAFDIWDEDETGLPVVLNTAESERLMAFVGHRWKAL